MILVDTNVWSETSKGNGSRKVVGWIEAHRKDLWLSAIVIAKLRAGIENPEAALKRDDLEAWLNRLEAANCDRLMLFDTAAAYVLATLLIAKPQDNKMLDTLIAAQAISCSCPIATRNVRDFEWTGVQLIDPGTPERRRARISELARLPDDDRPRADDEDRGNVGAAGH